MNPRDRIAKQMGVKSDYLIECADLREVIEPLIQLLDKDLDADDSQNRRQNPKASTNGAIRVLSSRVAEILGYKKDSPERRIYDIRYGKMVKTAYTMAEAIILALGSHISHYDLPVFPSDTRLAREIADVWLKGKPLAERRRFATTLLHFTFGYFSAEAAMEPLPVEKEQLADEEQLELVAA